MNIENIDNAFPLSAVQEGMLYHCLESNDKRVYVSHITFSINGHLNLYRWQSAWQETLQRHEALRTSFVWDGLDEPLQVVHSRVDPDWEVTDLRDDSATLQTDTLLKIFEHESRNGVDPISAPLMRFNLIRLSNESWSMVWSIHHLIADGWSTPLILQDVLAFYSQQGPKKPAPGYACYIEWSGNRDRGSAEMWWKKALTGACVTPMSVAPTRGSALPNAVHSVSRCCSAESAGEVKAYWQRLGITLSTLVHASWAFTVAAFADSDAPLFGTTVSGRHPQLVDSENIVGLLLSTVPVYLQLQNDTSIESFLQSLQVTLSASQEHDSLSLTALSELIDLKDCAAAFESIVVIESHQNDLNLQDAAKTITLSDISYSTHSHYPLALLAYPGERLEFKLVYDDQRFCSETVVQLLDYFMRQFTYITDGLARSVADCLAYREPVPDIITQEYIAESPLVHEWITSVAARSPESQAVVCGNESMCFRDLDCQSNRVAWLLEESGAGHHAAVGLFIPRCVAQIVGILGILKSGRHYVPLDTEAPLERTQKLVSSVDIELLLCTGTNRSGGINCRSINIEDAWQLSDLPAPLHSDNHNGSSLAYMMFTSGSTGTPKAVQISHQNLVSSIAARFDYYGNEPCKFLLLSALSFDSSVAGIYWALCSGGLLVLPAPGDEKDPQTLADIAARHQVTHTLCLPSLYSVILEHSAVDQLTSLEVVILAGEACQERVVRQHFGQLPEVRLYNEYGPTEATVWCTVHQLSIDDVGAVPIGRAISGSQVAVVDSRRHQCPCGAVGEIVVTGPGVSNGYYKALSTDLESGFSLQSNDSGRLASYYTGDLGYVNQHGLLMYAGRKDRQIKIRGYRIEPAEIESVILGHSAVTEAVVSVQRVSGGKSRDVDIDYHLSQLPQQIAESMLLVAEGMGSDSNHQGDSS